MGIVLQVEQEIILIVPVIMNVLPLSGAKHSTGNSALFQIDFLKSVFQNQISFLHRINVTEYVSCAIFLTILYGTGQALTILPGRRLCPSNLAQGRGNIHERNRGVYLYVHFDPMTFKYEGDTGTFLEEIDLAEKALFPILLAMIGGINKQPLPIVLLQEFIPSVLDLPDQLVLVLYHSQICRARR